MRPDRHEVWAAKAVEVTASEALERIAFIEQVLDTVREQLEMAVGLAEDGVMSAAERTTNPTQHPGRIFIHMPPFSEPCTLAHAGSARQYRQPATASPGPADDSGRTP
jgi:hypothetical protein